MESKKPSVRVSIPSLKPNSISLPHHLLFIFITVAAVITTAAISQFEESYSEHCDHIVPASNPTTLLRDGSHRTFKLDTGIFAGTAAGNATNGANSINFITFRVSETESDDVLHPKSMLRLEDFNSTSWVFSHGRNLSVALPRRAVVWRSGQGEIRFRLQGFWSSSSGKLCMVGSSSSKSQEGTTTTTVIHNVAFKLDYPNATTISTSLVSGVIESLDSSNDSLTYFDPIRVLGVSDKNYEYTLIEKEGTSEKFGDDKDNQTIGLAPTLDVCTDNKFVGRMKTFELDYGNGYCDDCKPLGTGFGVLPRFMHFGDLYCSENGRMHFFIWFSDSSERGDLMRRPIPTQTILLAEGLWDVNKNLLRVVACQISYSSFLANASAAAEDCSFKLSMRFSPTLSLRNMKVVDGQMWNNKSPNNGTHLVRVGFSEVAGMDVQGLTYEYTEIDNVNNICAKKDIRKPKGSVYPDEKSSDLIFMMNVRSTSGQAGQGRFIPLFVGNTTYTLHYDNSAPVRHGAHFNVSYLVKFRHQFGFDGKPGKDERSEILADFFAEGVYYRQTGFLCMKGCRYLDPDQRNLTRTMSHDCEIAVDVQYPPLNSKGKDVTKGTIKSTRAKSDPLYFDPLEISGNSIYTRQAAKTISRMDIEIGMVLLSYTVACVFVGMQLYYVKKHPDVLPFISVVMLIVLTLGHMVPLLLNFEALFLTKPNRANLYFDDGGWVEKNQVVVRVVTMIAFLLQTRLLQQTWSARSGDDESQKKLWNSEKKVVSLTLPLYIFGGLVTYFVYKWFHISTFSQQGRHLRMMGMGQLALLDQQRQQNFLWRDFRSYGGLIMDSFLLPQILLNVFSNSKEKALAPSYYMGTTVLRLLPHAYDLYRSRRTNSVFAEFDASFIYANHISDLYSTAWDLIIPCFGLLFAGIVYLQQRFGGRFFLPKIYRENLEYEKVAATNDA